MKKTELTTCAARLLATGLLCAAASLPAQAASWLLASADPAVVPGEAFQVVVIAPPDSEALPPRLAARIAPPGGGEGIAIELAAAEAEPVDPRQRHYFGRWPQELVGTAMLSLSEAPSARLLLDASAVATAAPAAAGGAPLAAVDGRVDSGVDRMAPVSPAISGTVPAAPNALGFHEPMYFVYGGSHPRSARFQFSFRYRIFDDIGVVAERFPLARGLYFGYTQTSVWDLGSDSKPFRDTSFRPSLFYQFRLSDPGSGGWATLAAGYEHESNGKDGPDTRSIDTLFLQTELRHYLDERGTYVGLIPKAWAYLGKRDNPDITRYRGYAQLGLRVGRDDALMATALLRRGTDGNSGTEIDLSYPLRRSIFSGVGAFVHFQYFRGYGETLRDYNVSVDPQYRIGLSFVR